TPDSGCQARKRSAKPVLLQKRPRTVVILSLWDVIKKRENSIISKRPVRNIQHGISNSSE
ncbi:MAG: hypothetical protein R6U27_14475, partial [Desulfobacterales bacterium]